MATTSPTHPATGSNKMTELVTLTVFGHPRPKPRHRPGKGHGKPVSVTSKKAKTWKASVERVARQVDRIPDWMAGAVRVDTWFYLPTPKADRWGQLHLVRPDKDNLEKMVLDCLERSGLLPNDCRVAAGEARKLWAQRGGCVIEIRPAEAPDGDDGLGVAFVAEDPA